MKGIAVTGTRGHVPGISFLDTTEAMRRVGNNCGNLVFQYAVDRLIAEETQIVGQDIPWDPDKVRETCRVVVIPSANFLRENFDFTGMVSFLERTELPLVFLGLGAQADDFDKAHFDFHPSILRLIDLIKERCAKVSVRGEFTIRVLEKYGVTNAAVTGCPSNFINPSPDLPDMIARKLDRPMESFITHADEPWPKKPIKKEVERRLVEWTRKGRAIMVQQSVPTEIRYLRQNNPFAEGPEKPRFEESLAKTIMPTRSIEDFREFVATRLRTYFSVDQWLEDSAKFDFSVGFRLHGNMVAWQAGTPALWITHDSRTTELVETMTLPHIPIDEFLENRLTVQDAIALLSFDKDAYRTQRKTLFARLIEVFRTESIPLHPRFAIWKS